MAYTLPASFDPAKSTPLEPSAICRAFRTPAANTLMLKPGGSLILSRGNVEVLRAAKMNRPTMKITRAARMSRTIGFSFRRGNSFVITHGTLYSIVRRNEEERNGFLRFSRITSRFESADARYAPSDCEFDGGTGGH